MLVFAISCWAMNIAIMFVAIPVREKGLLDTNEDCDNTNKNHTINTPIVQLTRRIAADTCTSTSTISRDTAKKYTHTHMYPPPPTHTHAHTHKHAHPCTPTNHASLYRISKRSCKKTHSTLVNTLAMTRGSTLPSTLS